MLRRHIHLAPAFLLTSAVFATTNELPPLTNCEQVAHCNLASQAEIRTFALKNIQIVHSVASWLNVRDSSGCVRIHHFDELPELKIGDVINASGRICLGVDNEQFVFGDRFSFVAHGPRVDPVSISAAEFFSPTNDYRYVKIVATVKNALVDEIDPRFCQFILLCENEIILAAYGISKLSSAEPKDLVNAKVSLAGFCVPRRTRNRRHSGRLFGILNLTVLQSASDNLSDIQNLAQLRSLSPDEVSTARQHRTTGRVLAVWDRSKSLLIQDNQREYVQVNLLKDAPPAVDDWVEAVGYPFSNSYHINLEHASWHPVPAPAPGDDDKVALALSTRELTTDEQGRRQFNPKMHGELIRLSGTVRKLSDGGGACIAHLEDGDYLVPVDFSICPDAREKLAVGNAVAITGVCVMDIERWAPATIPRVRGFFLVPRTAADIVVVARPPWLTRERLLAVVGGLVLLLVGVLVWNRSLHVLAQRRGRELFRAQIDKVATRLRVDERTRLAVELHDSLAQNLTGVSMEIEAAERCKADGLEAVSKHLSVADKALKSCRVELRNSLWDLRNQALEAPDVDSAIRQTLVPHVKNVNLVVRFNVPRARFSDNTLHEILRIIRELAVNGIRHGGANEIRIAGTLENGRLLFSVQDNGCGFDPDNHPGVTEGHFGLQGIAERLGGLAGTINFKRLDGTGMKAVVTIPLPGTAAKDIS